MYDSINNDKDELSQSDVEETKQNTAEWDTNNIHVHFSDETSHREVSLVPFYLRLFL